LCVLCTSAFVRLCLQRRDAKVAEIRREFFEMNSSSLSSALWTVDCGLRTADSLHFCGTRLTIPAKTLGFRQWKDLEIGGTGLPSTSSYPHVRPLDTLWHLMNKQ